MNFKRIIFPFIILLGLVLDLKAQIKGTLIIAGVGKDGLVLMSDSRAYMVNRQQKPIAYMDSVPKIFQLRRMYIGITGNSNIGNIFISQIITDFNKSPILTTDFISTVTGFVSYLDSLYPVSEYPDSYKTAFVFVGSDSINYMIQGYGRNDGYTRIVRKKTLISNNNAVPYLGDYYEKSSLFSCDSLVKNFSNTIYSFAKANNLQYEIGGPLSVVCIDLNNKLKYFKNSFSKNSYGTIKGFVKALKTGKRKFISIVPGGDKEALNAIIESHMNKLH